MVLTLKNQAMMIFSQHLVYFSSFKDAFSKAIKLPPQPQTISLQFTFNSPKKKPLILQADQSSFPFIRADESQTHEKEFNHLLWEVKCSSQQNDERKEIAVPFQQQLTKIIKKIQFTNQSSKNTETTESIINITNLNQFVGLIIKVKNQNKRLLLGPQQKLIGFQCCSHATFLFIQITPDFQSMNLFRSCLETTQIITSSFQEHAILTGVSDTVIVKQKDGKYKSTPLLVCFGPYQPTHQKQPVQLTINDHLIDGVQFSLDYKGYIQPQYLNDRDIRKMHLLFGVNKAVFALGDCRIQAEIYLYASNDKLVVSDVDGTVTKNDIGGHVHNFIDKDYLHEGYADLAKNIDKNGYKLVWLTMRALPLYNYSKNYLRLTVGVDGPILMEPQEFMPALSKQLLKKTGNIKANMMNLLRQLFTSNPFMAGLGNRENDAVAYLHAGVPLQKIFIIDPKSRVQIMSEGSSYISYRQMADNIQKYFPGYSAPKVGYM